MNDVGKGTLPLWFATYTTVVTNVNRATVDARATQTTQGRAIGRASSTTYVVGITCDMTGTNDPIAASTLLSAGCAINQEVPGRRLHVPGMAVPGRK